MRIAIVVVTLAATALSAQTPRAAQQEIDHVAAFAQLYGVVRYSLAPHAADPFSSALIGRLSLS